MALLEIRVTRPPKVRFGNASIRMEALSPYEILGRSVSSTLTLASITLRSAMVRRREPGLFIVPTIAVSPSWIFRRVTRPLIGATIVVFRSASRASERDAWV
jgi:hypothetical protein